MRTPTATPTIPIPTPTSAPAQVIRFAVIGDYGLASQPEADVASLVDSWGVDFVLTTGDNNYPSGETATIDQNIGQYYADYVGAYAGAYGSGAASNAFFPSLGNHDWSAPGASPYLAYFTLPGNERYYHFSWGPVDFYALDSDPGEPDGIDVSSTQAAWLQAELAAATGEWQIVYFHHAPYSSGTHGSTAAMQWPFAAWGADAVLAGHDHTYERLEVNGIPYFVNGLGGNSIYSFTSPLAESLVRYNGDFGAMLVEATRERVTYRFIDRTGAAIDTHVVDAAPVFADVPASHWAHDYIEALYDAGYVAGCQATPVRLYCPDRILSRAESAVFVERGQHGAIANPPYPTPPSPTFVDVAPSFWGFGWIESLWTDGFTAGCSASPLAFCPDRQHTRAEGSVFFLRIRNGASYSPPVPTRLFADVPPSAWFAGWVEAAYNQGILPACQDSPLYFCPDAPLDRAWAAYSMVQARGIPVP